MIKGITVKLINLIETDKDSIGEPIYTEKIINVENVLISPSSSDDLVVSTNLSGKKCVYTLAIPKGDKNIWENQYVEFYGHRYHVLNFVIEGIEDNIPLNWNKKVMVERYA